MASAGRCGRRGTTPTCGARAPCAASRRARRRSSTTGTRWWTVAGSSESYFGARRPRVALVALGCRVSRADVDALAGEIGRTFDLARGGDVADFVVVNTCAITCDAESAARQAIRRAAREHPGAPIVAAGCFAEVAPEELAALPGVAAVVGARSGDAVCVVLERLLDGAGAVEAVRGAVGDAWGSAPVGPARHTRPFLKVQDGCDQRCTYCTLRNERVCRA